MASPTIQIGNEYFIRNSSYVKLWGIQFVDDGASHCNILVNRYDTSGVFAETVLTIRGATGAIEADQDEIAGAADAAVAITGSVLRVQLNSSTGAKSITTDTSGTDAVWDGQVVAIFAPTVSGGSYTLAVDEGTLTFDAADEAAVIQRVGSVWRVRSLRGATIV